MTATYKTTAESVKSGVEVPLPPSEAGSKHTTLSLPIAAETRRPDTTKLLPIELYDLVIVSFSGGKDSIALVLSLLEQGVPKHKIQLWHQCIDGEPGSPHFMDWPCTESYCKAFAKAMGLRILFQWRHGGFKREMLKENARSAPVSFERQDGMIGTAGGIKGKISTRRLYPQVTSDLMVRWCSPSLKIDVMGIAINNEPTFKKGKRILVLTGERRQESTARSRYAEMEQHRCHSNSRRVDQWRKVIDWSTQEVWACLERNRIVPHPGYRLGWGRLSCMKCVFIGPDEWATNHKIDPVTTGEAANYEKDFGKTIKRGKSIVQQVAEGKAFPGSDDAGLVALALNRHYPEDQVILPQGSIWTIPAGAYRAGGGPT